MNDLIVTLDVRGDIRHGREPFGRIMQTVGRLRPTERLRLLAPFEPVPLFRVLANQGFTHEAKPMRSGDWEVVFSREEGDLDKGEALRDDAGPAEVLPGAVELDARGLEPPRPLVKILETLATLPAGTELCVHTDRRPLHLYGHLKERGFTGESEEQEDGSFVTHIRPA